MSGPDGDQPYPLDGPPCRGRRHHRAGGSWRLGGGLLRGLAGLAVLLSASSLMACNAKEDECAALLAHVHRDIDDGSARMLQRGPDELYLTALGLGERTVDPGSRRIAEQAGLDLGDDALEAQRAEARRSFRSHLQTTTARLHQRADTRLAAQCAALEGEAASCLARYPRLVTERDTAVDARCDDDDRQCRSRMLEAWKTEHPPCALLDEWVDTQLEQGTSG